MPRIIIIDKDPAIRLLLRRGLIKAGHSVQDIEPGETAAQVDMHQFDLLILDIDFPGERGPELIRGIRDQSPIPILVLSNRCDEHTVIVALKNGADDLVRKPFGLGEFLARAENALRRRAREQGQHVRVSAGNIEIDLWHRRVYSRGVEVHLPVKEYEVLRVLSVNADRVVAHHALLGTVWGPRGNGRLSYLRLAIRALRRKLEPDPARPQHILTETRIGYCLRTQAPASCADHRQSVEPGAK